MYLIVGLGNPGKQYEKTRHNFGFRIIDFLTSETGWENKYDSLFLKTEDTILAKPQLFMNQSGKAVAQILKYYPAARVIVVHDELDLPLGSLKIVKNSGAAGHNGVQSVIDEIGTKDFIRVRLGIANPETQGNLPAEDFVLKDFSQQEEALVKETIDKAAGALETIQTEGLELAQSKFNAS